MKKTKVRAKNPRTTFSFLQKLALENEFRRTPYPTVALRAQLAEKLGLRQEVVQVLYIRSPKKYQTLEKENLTELRSGFYKCRDPRCGS